MGGGATWRYALSFPERVSAMILVNAVPPNRDWGKTPVTDEQKTAEHKTPPLGLACCGNPGFEPSHATLTQAC